MTRDEWTLRLLADTEALWHHMDEVQPLDAEAACHVAVTSARWLVDRQLKDIGDLITLAVAVLTFARERALVEEQKRAGAAS